MQMPLIHHLAAILMSLLAFFIASSSCAETAQQKRELYLRGNEMWGHYCASCHNAPPPSARSPHTWDTVTMHMRTRANIPAAQVEDILEYLRSR